MTATQKTREAILVFGMHRSGTSATTRVVNLLGADLNDELHAPRSDNAKGFWESVRAVHLHERLFEGLSRSWYDMSKLPEGWTEHPSARQAVREIVQLITEDFADSTLWAIKDPRMCLFAPLWLEALAELDIETKALFVVRNPLEVAESLRTRDQWSRGHAALLWAQYMVEPLLATHGIRRAMITYDELLADWQATMARVGSDLDVVWPHAFVDVAAQVDDFLDAGERHHRAPSAIQKGEDESLPRLVVRIYQECLRITRTHAAWDQLNLLAEEFEDVVNLYGPAVEDIAGRQRAAEKRAGDAEVRASGAEHLLAAGEPMASAVRQFLENEVGRLQEVEHHFSERFDAVDRTLAAHFAASESRHLTVETELSKVVISLKRIKKQLRIVHQDHEDDVNRTSISIASLSEAGF